MGALQEIVAVVAVTAADTFITAFGSAAATGKEKTWTVASQY